MLEIIRAGMWTTIQDRGRFQHRRDGVVTAGAMDEWAMRIANLLVGNSDSQSESLPRLPIDEPSAIEFFLVGPTIDFHSDAIFAIYGGCWNAFLEGQAIRCGTPYIARCGQRLEVREATAGAWGYLAINGVIDVPKVLGSRSTHTRSTMGGFQGRALNAGDKIGFKSNCSALKSATNLARRYVPWTEGVYGTSRDENSIDGCMNIKSQNQPLSSTIRFVLGSHWGMLDSSSQDALTASQWLISKKSDRMGYRLEKRSDSQASIRSDSTRLQLASPFEMLSEPNTIGTIQLPSGGEPIILMSDAATTGGYPRLGHVIQVDLPRLAQQRPGAAIQLQAISLADAHQLLIARERLWQRLVYGVHNAFRLNA